MTAVEVPLLRRQAYVDGRWVDADSGATFPVTNPATGETLAEVPRMGAAETRRAIEAAARALPEWRRRTAKERARVLRRLADLMLAHEDELARLMVLEQGKPLAEARAEVAYAASFFEWFAEEGKRVYGDTIPSPWPEKRILVTKEPVGVTVGITPWNFPAAMPARKAAPALAAGCTMVLKPAEQTPLSALAIAALAEEAGLPPGVLSVVTGAAEDAPVIGAEMTSNPLVRKLGFTGSTAVGKLLMAQCAAGVKKVSLELGGNAPFLVFDDADLEEAVAGALLCKFRNSGQTCISANRLLVQDGIFDDFVTAFTEAVRGLKVADGFTEGVQVGPLIDEPALEKVERHVADALERGGELLVGGERIEGQFYRPSVIVGVPADAAMSCEETFGPVAGIARFETEEEAVRAANETPYGLAAYFYARDLGRVVRVAEALEAGIVGINTGLISTEVAPFGGVKESGIGREGSSYGIEEWLELKYWALGGIGALP
ncbi:MAG: NAD-dependent succinate-semialdehyde dehydrogenase [Thermoleophilia bacterium]|nr:NAD-dependent succinate-semialdehyde dehydrogenase [Gaiellaceae bacterium]MDW8337539.1 NAD-dependent succinate-semialdehyde dehydrogenase [Thermoleophilia bacterium]